jgi:hypothetical protein
MYENHDSIFLVMELIEVPIICLYLYLEWKSL